MRRAVTAFIALALVITLPPVLHAARLVVKLPPEGAAEVELLSGGTRAVLDLLRTRLDSELASARESCRMAQLEREERDARLEVSRSEKTYKERLEGLKARAISSIRVTVHSSEIRITEESSTGDVSFHYSVTNTGDRIVSDIAYRPVISGITIPLTTPLVLEFIEPSTLVFGLGPQETITNRLSDPERLSFFLSELRDADRRILARNTAKTFSLEVEDVHFVSRKGFKGQYKVMDLPDAYSGILEAPRTAFERAVARQATLAAQLADARKSFENETRAIRERFRTRAADLRKASVRATCTVDRKKNRAVFEDLEPDTYLVFAAGGPGKAALEKVVVKDGKNVVKLKGYGKDPFTP